MKLIKVKDLLNAIEIEKEKVQEVAEKYEEIKPYKIVENRLLWEKVRDKVIQAIMEEDKFKPFYFKIANEILSAYDKALRESDKIAVNINIDNRVFTIRVKGEGEKKILLKETGIELEGEGESDGG